MAENIDVENVEPQMEPTEDDKLWALLAYVLTPLIPIIIYLLEEKKDRPFIRAHNAQALAWGIISIVLGGIVGAVLCGIPYFVLWAIGVYWGWQAYQGKTVEIPVVSQFVRDQGWA